MVTFLKENYLEDIIRRLWDNWCAISVENWKENEMVIRRQYLATFDNRVGGIIDTTMSGGLVTPQRKLKYHKITHIKKKKNLY